MARKFSTGLRGAILGNVAAVTLTDISFVIGTAKILTAAGNFLTSGFRPGDVILPSGTASNNLLFTVTSIASDGSDMVLDPAPSTEGAGASMTITAAGKGFEQSFKNGVLRIYSGSQPTDADDAETGTLLVEITVSSATLTPGVSTNGLNFDVVTPDTDRTESVLAKSTGEVWSGTALATGTAGYGRFYDNGRIVGASETSIRFDGSAGTSGAQFNLSTTTITSGATITVDTCTITLARG